MKPNNLSHRNARNIGDNNIQAAMTIGLNNGQNTAQSFIKQSRNKDSLMSPQDT
jgi:hypothetical protein